MVVLPLEHSPRITAWLLHKTKSSAMITSWVTSTLLLCLASRLRALLLVLISTLINLQPQTLLSQVRPLLHGHLTYFIIATENWKIFFGCDGIGSQVINRLQYHWVLNLNDKSDLIKYQQCLNNVKYWTLSGTSRHYYLLSLEFCVSFCQTLLGSKIYNRLWFTYNIFTFI